MQLVMAHSHIPRFGNWEADNIPYSACFENALKEKAGFMMNPNDAMENPEAFKGVGEKVVEHNEVNKASSSLTNYSHHHKASSSMEKERHHVVRNRSSSRRHSHSRSRGSKGSSFGGEFAVEKSHSDHKRSVSKEATTIGRFSSSSHNRHKSASHNDHEKYEVPAPPEFGNWDVRDPKSGEGYSAIFSKIKEEKQITPSHIASIRTVPPNNSSNNKNQYAEPSSFKLSKYCCCLFKSESK